MTTKRVGLSKTYLATTFSSNPSGVRDDLYTTLKTYATNAGFTVVEGLIGSDPYFTFTPEVAFPIASDTPKYFIKRPSTNVAQVEVGAWSGDSFTAAYSPTVVPITGATGLSVTLDGYMSNGGTYIAVPFDFYFNGMNSDIYFNGDGYFTFGGQSFSVDKFWELGDGILIGAGDRGVYKVCQGMDGANYRVYIEATSQSYAGGVNRKFEVIFKPDNSITINFDIFAIAYNDYSGVVVGGVYQNLFSAEKYKTVTLTSTNLGTTWTLTNEPTSFIAKETFGLTSITTDTTFRAAFDAKNGEFFLHYKYSTTSRWIYFGTMKRIPEDVSTTEICRYGYIYSYYDQTIFKTPWMRCRDGAVVRGYDFENYIYGVLRVNSALGGYPSSLANTTDVGVSKCISGLNVMTSYYEGPIFLSGNLGSLAISANQNVAGLVFTDLEVYKNTYMAVANPAGNFAYYMLPIPSAGLTALANF